MSRTLRVATSVLVLAASSVLVSADPVAAGGSNWTFDRERYQPGDTAFAWAQIAWEHNPTLGTPREGPYHAVLEPYPSYGEPRVRVGDITISLDPYQAGSMRFGPHHAEISFMIPNLPPGQYVLVHANESGKTVGDLSGATVIWIDAPSVRATPNFAG